MFSDKFGLTEDVLLGRKTMTRRIAYTKEMKHRAKRNLCNDGRLALYDGSELVAVSKYRLGEELAIAQSYKQCWNIYQKRWESYNDPSNWITPDVILGDSVQETAGWNNKMSVKADLMPYRIRITGIKAERLQDISYDDCRYEGIIPVTWRQWHKQDIDDFSPQRYTDHDVWTLEKFREGIEDPWAESEPGEFVATTPQVAFAVLIFKMMGKRMWYDNPWVFAYTFELIK